MTYTEKTYVKYIYSKSMAFSEKHHWIVLTQRLINRSSKSISLVIVLWSGLLRKSRHGLLEKWIKSKRIVKVSSCNPRNLLEREVIIVAPTKRRCLSCVYTHDKHDTYSKSMEFAEKHHGILEIQGPMYYSSKGID